LLTVDSSSDSMAFSCSGVSGPSRFRWRLI
jgi:hypothetical protein